MLVNDHTIITDFGRARTSEPYDAVLYLKSIYTFETHVKITKVG